MDNESLNNQDIQLSLIQGLNALNNNIALLLNAKRPLQFYSIETAAMKLEMSVDMLQYMTRPGHVEIPFSWMGRVKKFCDDDLMKWYEENRVQTVCEERVARASKDAKNNLKK